MAGWDNLAAAGFRASATVAPAPWAARRHRDLAGLVRLVKAVQDELEPVRGEGGSGVERAHEGALVAVLLVCPPRNAQDGGQTSSAAQKSEIQRLRSRARNSSALADSNTALATASVRFESEVSLRTGDSACAASGPNLFSTS